jgi:hypothetical protein
MDKNALSMVPVSMSANLIKDDGVVETEKYPNNKLDDSKQEDFFLDQSKNLIKLKQPDFEIRRRVQANPRLIY